MEKTSKELLQLEHSHLSSSKESVFLVSNKAIKAPLEETAKLEGKLFTAPLPKSQVLGKVKDFLGVISEANKSLQFNAKDKPQDYDIEALNGNESEYIEMDLMLGVADLHTPEAMAAAEAAIAGNQPVFDLPSNGTSSESESNSENDDDNDEDEHSKVDRKKQSERRQKKKRPEIVELS